MPPHHTNKVVDAGRLRVGCRLRRGLHQQGPAEPVVWSADLGVTEEELDDAVRRLGAKDTAPGPDGIPGRAWGIASGILGPRLCRLFSAALDQGVFPSIRKEGRLVLLQKDGRPTDSPSAYRPIVLLDEGGKLFERVIANRLVHHLSSVGPDLADIQFGFRERRSTIDAIQRVRTLAESATSKGGVALGVSLDRISLQRIIGAFLAVQVILPLGVWATVLADDYYLLATGRD